MLLKLCKMVVISLTVRNFGFICDRELADVSGKILMLHNEWGDQSFCLLVSSPAEIKIKVCNSYLELGMIVRYYISNDFQILRILVEICTITFPYPATKTNQNLSRRS